MIVVRMAVIKIEIGYGVLKIMVYNVQYFMFCGEYLFGVGIVDVLDVFLLYKRDKLLGGAKTKQYI